METATALLQKLAKRSELKTNKFLRLKVPAMLEQIKARTEVLDTLPIGFAIDTTFSFPNSGYVDFGAIAGQAGQILFSSLRSDKVIKQGPTDPVFETTNIYRYSPSSSNPDGFTRIEVLKDLAPAGYQVGNPSLSPDGKLLFYSACKPTASGGLHCQILRAELDAKGKVLRASPLDGKINKAGSSNTQPWVVETKNKGIGLYFASDRKGTKGGMDIFYASYDAKKKTFANPSSAGKGVNTSGNEGFPHYEASTGKLFFSSDGHSGFGGYDVFVGQGKGFEDVANLGQPLNSASDDISFHPADATGTTGYLASNRPGATILVGSNCCEDIFLWKRLAKPIRQEGLLAARRLALEKAAQDAARDASLAAAQTAAEADSAAKVLAEQRAKAELDAKAKAAAIAAEQAQLAHAAAKLALAEKEAQSVAAKKESGRSAGAEKAALVLAKVPKLARKDTVAFRAKDLAKNESTAPDAIMAMQVKRISQRIRFQLGSSTLIDESISGLDTLAIVMAAHPTWRIVLTGHTDSKGSAAHNQRLGFLRAQAVADYIASKGIDQARIASKSRGSSTPIFPNTTDENRARNRRVTAAIKAAK